MNKRLFWLALPLLLAACSKPVSPQAKVILDMRQAICQSGSLAAAKPYVTQSSRAILDFGEAMLPFAKLFGGEQQIQDALAKDCQHPPTITNEIRVNDRRYLIEYRDSEGSHEAAVVLEQGAWKLQL